MDILSYFTSLAAFVWGEELHEKAEQNVDCNDGEINW